MAITLIILFLVIGFLLVLVEVLITPGIIVGALGVLFMAFGIYKTYDAYGFVAGNWALFGSFAASVLGVVIALRSGAWHQMSLKGKLEGRMNEIDFESLKPGDTGVSLSALRPMGTALINDKRVEVVCPDEPIEPQTEIEITQIKLNKIYVKRKL